jgi:hypothetical protein
MAITKVINDLADLNQLGSTNALKGCAGTTAQQPVVSSSIEYVIVGGGGGGGTNGSATGDGLGGGGAGGYVTGTTTVYHGTPTVLTVGDGGNGGTIANGYEGINGDDSGFNGIRAIGGGGGGAGSAPGLDGGSGGGGGRNADPAYHSIYYGSALDNQGNNGGSGGYTPGSYQASTGGGGGGSNATGSNGANSASGNGGSGGNGTNINGFIDYTNATTAGIGDISGTDVYISGGGGGGAYSGTKGTGGDGGGGAGGQSGTTATSGSDNTGGGGGGDGNAESLGGSGGSGVVILQYDNTEVTGYTITGSLVGGVNTTDNSAVVDFPAGAGCQALYQFENNTNDSSSNSYNPTSEANTSFPTSSPAPKFGTYSLSLNGSTTYVNGIPSGLTTKIRTAGQFSISVWINPKTRPSGSGYSGGDNFIKLLDDIYLSIFLDEELTLNYSVIPSPGVYIEYPQTQSVRRINLNEWSHICLTGSATNGIKFYINGQQETYNPSWPGTFITYTDSNYKTNGLTANYPNLPGNPTKVLDGNLDNLRVYDNELTASQVLELTNTNLTTKFVDSPTVGTDTLVFKGGTGNISFENSGPPGGEIGMLRYNSTLGQMEHFNSGGWKDFTNCTTSVCNYPTTARCLYTFDGNIIDSCGNTTPDLIQNIYYNSTGKFDQRGWTALGTSSSLGYSKLGWSSGLGVNYNTSDFSISLWLKQDSYASYSACSSNPLCYGYIWSGWSNSYWTLATDHQLAGNTIAWKSWGPGAGQIQTAESGIVDLNTWYHIVATRSTTDGIQLWLNNQLVASVSGSFTAGTASVYDMMGGYGDTGYTRQGLNGSISQFRLFESVLTPTQISQLYNEISCP